MSVRKDNWPRHLLDAVNRARGKRFEWGEHDCFLFVSDCVDAVLVQRMNIAGPYRGRYNDVREAARLAHADGYRSVPAYLVAKFGPPLGPYQAMRGDVLEIDNPDRPGITLGICMGRQAACLDQDHGITMVDMDRWTRCWAVGVRA